MSKKTKGRKDKKWKPGNWKAQNCEKNRLLAVMFLDLMLLISIAVTGGLLFWRSYQKKNCINLSEIEIPFWQESILLTENPYSRPGTKRTRVRDIVIHYVANPETSAMQNRNYFQSLSRQFSKDPVSASSHYIIGLDGEIIHCIPLDEVAYANYPRNEDTVSIECCHPDETGVFTEATRESLIRLTAWLCRELRLDEKDVIRHYDVSGKQCPLYYVTHEEAWKQLLAEIRDTLRDRKKGKES